MTTPSSPSSYPSPLTPISELQSPENDSDSDSGSTGSLSSVTSQRAIIDPELYYLIPSEMLGTPTLPLDLIWHCPVGGGSCSYSINLLAPTNDNLSLIQGVVDQDDIVQFLSKDWKANDELIFHVFYEMVNRHWVDHLNGLDIRYVRRGDSVSD